MGEQLLNIQDLYVEYLSDEGNVKAVNGINLRLEKGETLGLVGETGAGKTTTALAVMRLLPSNIGRISGGVIDFDGLDVVNASEGEMRLTRGDRISMIFQDPMTSLNPVMTVGDQILEVLTFHEKKVTKEEMDQKVDEILGLVGISPGRKREYPHQFSGGMKQRVVIAIALACNPELLIADEPTTALDVTIQAQVLEMMDELKSQMGTAMILITHDLGVVAQMCDRVAIMYAGEIIEYGAIEDILDRGKSHHPYTVGLFNSIPNLRESTARLSPIEGLMPDPRELPSGCKFHPRCPRCMEVCKGEIPRDIEMGGIHRIKCYFFDDAVGKEAESGEPDLG